MVNFYAKAAAAPPSDSSVVLFKIVFNFMKSFSPERI